MPRSKAEGIKPNMLNGMNETKSILVLITWTKITSIMPSPYGACSNASGQKMALKVRLICILSDFLSMVELPT